MSMETWIWHFQQITFIRVPMETVLKKVIQRLNFCKSDSEHGNLLTEASTFRCRELNAHIKFDYEKSSLEFAIRLGIVTDRQLD